MIKHGMCDELIDLLAIIFNNMIKQGHTPENFNISLVTPIPKKGKAESVSDYRPISVSTAYAQIYEALLLKKQS